MLGSRFDYGEGRHVVEYIDGGCRSFDLGSISLCLGLIYRWC